MRVNLGGAVTSSTGVERTVLVIAARTLRSPASASPAAVWAVLERRHTPAQKLLFGNLVEGEAVHSVR